MTNTQSRSRFFLNSCVVLLVTAALGGAVRGADYDLADLNKMAGRQVVEQYERKHAESPDNIGYRLNLALLYALSSVLDPSLDTGERARRKDEAVKLVETEFRKEMSKTDPDKVRALHTGFILAQVYLTLSDTGKCDSVFSSLRAKFPGDSDVEAAVAKARAELESRMGKGYPYDAVNPWGPTGDTQER